MTKSLIKKYIVVSNQACIRIEDTISYTMKGIKGVDKNAIKLVHTNILTYYVLKFIAVAF